MIIKIGAWFYLANAALALLSVLVSPFGFMSGSTLMTLIYAGLFGAMGFGLLQREKWGRFMALGCSLLGWTLGALLLIGLIAYVLVVAKLAMLFGLLFAGGMFAALAWMVLVTLVLWAIGVIISFKLFWHLCSPEGCEEFGEPPISAPTIIASTGAWLGLAFINLVFTGSGSFMQEISVASARSDSADEARRAEQRELELQQALREREARRAAAQVPDEAEMPAPLEAEAPLAESPDPSLLSEAPPASDAPQDGAESQAATEPPLDSKPEMIEESQAPAIQSATAEEESEAPSSRKVLKCRDSSGGITFTQGYCPPGSKQVEMTPAQ